MIEESHRFKLMRKITKSIKKMCNIGKITPQFIQSELKVEK